MGDGRNLAVTLLALAAALAGCGEKRDAIQIGDYCEDVIERQVSWDSDARAVFAAHCTRCHATTKQGIERSGAPAGADFDSFAEASPLAGPALDFIRRLAMPPSGSTMSSADCAAIRAWIEQGKVER